MLSCAASQVQLLEYLYDVLDPAERQALESHLAACPACAAALNRTRTQQELLASAARLQFPQLKFEAPAQTPAVLPLEARRRARRARQVRWAVAAAVLLALGLPALKFANDYTKAQHLVAANERAH